MFEVNHEEAKQSGGLMPEGEYEVIIKSALEDATKGGTQYINVPLIVRNDIEQPYKNAYIWHAIWKLKEPKTADVACGGYSSNGIQILSKAAKLINGKKYGSLAEWGEDLKNKLLRVTVKHEEYNGNTQAKVKTITETKYPQCNHVYKTSPTVGVMPDGSSDKDLPF
jgi:hypothetical protein